MIADSRRAGAATPPPSAEDAPPGDAPDGAAIEARLDKIVTGKPGPFSPSGAVMAVSDGRGAVTVRARGADARGAPVSADSLLLLASASKLATGLLILRLVERGALALDASIGTYLPEARAAEVPGVTIARMLSHTSGLPIEIGHDLSTTPGPVRWEAGLRWPGAMAEACLAARLEAEPGTVVQYSNVAYGLLGLAAERVTGTPFARLLDQEVFAPLGIEAYVDQPPPREPMAVSDVPSPHVGTELEPYNSAVGRGLGAPWVGVTTNVSGLLAMVRAYLDDGALLSPAMAAEARRNRNGGLPGGFVGEHVFLGHNPSRPVTWTACEWGLAIEVQGGKQPHWAPANLPHSFGQIGSSGCLGWCDPASGVAWAIFGARAADSGWLLRHGARIAQTALAAAG